MVACSVEGGEAGRLGHPGCHLVGVSACLSATPLPLGFRERPLQRGWGWSWEGGRNKEKGK